MHQPQQWHLGVQRELWKNLVATVSYVGSKGTHLTRYLDLNQLQPVPLRQNPYKPGEPISDCGITTDDNGVPMDALTPSGAPVPYFAPTTPGGLPTGPAVNLSYCVREDCFS